MKSCIWIIWIFVKDFLNEESYFFNYLIWISRQMARGNNKKFSKFSLISVIKSGPSIFTLIPNEKIPRRTFTTLPYCIATASQQLRGLLAPILFYFYFFNEANHKNLPPSRDHWRYVCCPITDHHVSTQGVFIYFRRIYWRDHQVSVVWRAADNNISHTSTHTTFVANTYSRWSDGHPLTQTHFYEFQPWDHFFQY